jgi:hypothetical protein
MVESVSFRDLWNRVRAGDAQAATDLVRQFEPLIRHEIRLRMTDPRLTRAFDSTDVCQSVLASFFARAACGPDHGAEQAGLEGSAPAGPARR